MVHLIRERRSARGEGERRAANGEREIPAAEPGTPNPNLRVYSHRMARTANAATAGIGFGTALAITISWSVNKSLLWAIIHGLFSWLYVLYYALTR